MQDYFAIFELPRDFELNLAELEKRYFVAQRKFHPDRLVGKGPAERQQAVVHSMLVNEAYETLKLPLKRAQHMLAVADVPQQKPSQELLTEIMDLREALTMVEAPDTLAKLEQTVTDSKQVTLTSLSRAFDGGDNTSAAELAMRLSYLMKLEDDIRARRKTLTA